MGEGNTTEYVRNVASKHLAPLVEARTIHGARVLEIGPGGNLAAGGLFLKAGVAAVTCIDIEPWVTDHAALYSELDVTDEVARVVYEWPVAVESALYSNGAFDVIFSQGCFEHFADPGAAMENIARMLSPGGVTSHEVDLRDHRHGTEPLEMLRYSNRSWRLATSNRPGQTNRWRASDLVEGFRAAGLEIVRAEPTRSTLVTKEMRDRLHRDFLGKSLEDLGTLALMLVAVKR